MTRPKPLNIADNRTRAQLIEDGDDKWPDGTRYVPPKPSPPRHCTICGDPDPENGNLCRSCYSDEVNG